MNPARIALLACLMLLPGANAGAQAIHKCKTPQGRTIYSDKPCNQGQRAVTLQPGPAQTPASPAQGRPVRAQPTGAPAHIAQKAWKQQCERGSKAACDALASLKSGRSPEQIAAEHAEALCAKGQREQCEIYCRDDPSSKQCLEKTGRAWGTSWYESSRRVRNRAHRTTGISIACREAPPAGYEPGSALVTCAGNNSDCYHDRTLDKQFATLDAAANDACALARQKWAGAPGR